MCCIYSVKVFFSAIYRFHDGLNKLHVKKMISSLVIHFTGDPLHVSHGKCSEVLNLILDYDLSISIEFPDFPITEEFWIKTM